MNATAAILPAPNRSRAWMSFALVVMLVVSIFSSAIGLRGASAQTPYEGLASAVPADTVMFMSANLDQDSPQWELTFQLLERAGLSDLAEAETGSSVEDLGSQAEASDFTGTAAIVFTDADSLASYSSADLSAAPGLTMAEMDAEEFAEGIPEGFALIAQPEDPAALSSQFVNIAQEEAISGGATLETVDYNGVTISFWTPSDPTVAGTATAEVDGTVVLATRASDIEPIIDTVQGNLDNLADTDGFTDVASRLQGDSLVFGYFNLDVLIDALANDPEFAALYGDMMMGQDLESGKGHAGWVVYATDAGFHMDSVMVLDDPSMMTEKVFTPTMAENMPADVMFFSVANDLYSTGISDVLGTLFQEIMGEMSGTGVATPGVATPTVDETWAMVEAQLGFNPDTDLLAHLDGEYAAYLGVYDLDGFMPNPEFLFVSETSDAVSLEQTTATITNMVNLVAEGEVEISTRSVDDGELTVIHLNPADTMGLPMVLEYGVVNDEMLIGLNGAIDRYLDPTGAKLADDPNFQATFDHLPSENLVNVSYLNVEGQVMPLLDWFSEMLLGSMTTLDNHEECGNYATQEEAQEAYDADPGGLWLLDMNFDGVACEDYFDEATPSASPETISEQVNIPAAGMVTWVEDNAVYSSSILVIGD